jgi:peroxiredoxin Q/BCP
MKRRIALTAVLAVLSLVPVVEVLGEHKQEGAATMPAGTSTLPAVGAEAPDFTLPDANGQNVSLSDLEKSKAVVVYFYPKADTPGCTKEACGFRDAISQYQKMGIAVVGISPDPVEDIRKFADKYGLRFPLLADADHSVSEKYGVWQEKNNYGKKYWGVARTTFVIQGDKIAHVFEKVKPEGHDQEVLEWIKANVKA